MVFDNKRILFTRAILSHCPDSYPSTWYLHHHLPLLHRHRLLPHHRNPFRFDQRHRHYRLEYKYINIYIMKLRFRNKIIWALIRSILVEVYIHEYRKNQKFCIFAVKRDYILTSFGQPETFPSSSEICSSRFSRNNNSSSSNR